MSFDSLPLEIQHQILLNLYPKWWLEVEELQVYTANPVYKIVACRPMMSGPLFTCRAMYRATRAVLDSQFTGLLDATCCLHMTSIIPSFKVFLPRVTMVIMDQSSGALQMSYIYAQKLSALRVIRLKSCVTWPVEGRKLAEALDSDKADADLIKALYAPEIGIGRVVETARALTQIQFLFEQVFRLEGAAAKALVTFDVSTDSPRIIEKASIKTVD